MLNLIQVTVQYSNAVLVAILPQISDFVSKAELPIPAPITIQQVETFKCSPVQGDIGGAVLLTNGLWVLYLQGHVYDLRTPRSYYNLQNARDIPKFYGPLHLNKEQALESVRRAIRRLGYSLTESFTDQEPQVDMPVNIGTNVVPYYRFLWRDPVSGKTAVRVELNADSNRIEEIRLSSPFFWRAPPKVAVQPAVREAQFPVNEAASNGIVTASLPEIEEFGRKLKLPVPFPMDARQIQGVEFFGATGALLSFSNGYSFTCENGVVTEFSAPDSISSILPVGPPPRPFASYLGNWNLSETEATEIVRRAIENLGYKTRDFDVEKPPDIKKSAAVGKYLVPRYRLFWIANDPATGKTLSLVSAEINGDKKRLEHLQLAGGPLPMGVRNVNGESKTSTNPRPEPPVSQELLDFVERNMRSATNAVRTNPTVKPSNPFE
jgi:hypothetical protein